jgi:hypothetical protein
MNPERSEKNRGLAGAVQLTFQQTRKGEHMLTHLVVTSHFVSGTNPQADARGYNPVRAGIRNSECRASARPASYHCRWKFTSILTATVTGSPSFIPGLKRHCDTAVTAFASRPGSSDFATLIFWATPSGETSP